MSRHRPRNPARGLARAPSPDRQHPAAPRRAATRATPLTSAQWMLLFLLLAVSAAVFSPVMRAEYLNYDDDIYVTENPYVRRLDGQSVQTLFTTPYQNQYAPVAMLLMAVEFQTFGGSAAALRWVSILVHLANVVLLFVLIRRLFQSFPLAIITAALFAVHPLQVESVAWITAHMKIGWYVLFGLGALIAYHGWAQTRRAGALILSLVLFALSCLSKEQAVALVGTLPVIDWVLRRDLRRGSVWLEKLPFVAVAVAIGSVTLSAAGRQQGEGDILVVFGLGDRVILTAYAFASYLAKLVAPLQLSAFMVYPTRVPPLYALSFVAVAGVLALLVYAWQKGHRVVVFGVTFFITHIALTLANQIFALRDVLMADRYLYLASAGAFVLVARGWERLVERVPPSRTVLSFAMVAVLCVFAVASYQRAGVWHDSVSLFSDVIEKEVVARGRDNPFLALPYSNRGVARKNRGDVEGGLADFNEAIRINPNDVRSWVNRANVYFNRQEYERALPDYERALVLDPKNAIAHSNRGSVFANRGRFDAALADFDKALELNPHFIDALRNRGMVYQALGRHEQALQDFDRLLALRPLPDVYALRAASYQALGRVQEAEADLARSRGLR